MKISRILSFAAIAVTAIAIVSCDARNRYKSDDESDAVTEDVVDNYSGDVDYSDYDMSPAVERFVKKGKTYLNRISNARTEAQLSNIDSEMDTDWFGSVSSNYSSFSTDDRAAVIMILCEVYGQFMEKSLDFGDEEYTYEQKYEMGYNLGEMLGKIVMQSDNFAELYEKMVREFIG